MIYFNCSFEDLCKFRGNCWFKSRVYFLALDNSLVTAQFKHPSASAQKEADLVIGHVVEHLLDLHGVFHGGGDWVRGAEGVHLHGLETFPQEEVILGEKEGRRDVRRPGGEK